MAPTLSALVDAGYVDATAVDQRSVFDAATLFAQTEGILPAPESSHAICSAINEALEAKEMGEKRVILFNLSGHGHFDLAAYDAYHKGNLGDSTYPDEMIADIPNHIPQVNFA
jgi:tryptophan synthase beta chain